MKQNLDNRFSNIYKVDSSLVLIFILSFIYFLFPINTHLSDSYDYAASVRYADKLFSAHHLLYNYFNHLIFVSVKFIYPAVDAMRLMQFIDASFAVLCLIILRRILLLCHFDKSKSNAWTLFVACSFGVMRFAVEAETYIIPIFISLISSWYYLKALQSGKLKYVFYSGLFASLACLFHQIHLFWGIGLFFGFLMTKKTKNVLIFLIPTPLVLVVYSIVLVYYNQTAFSVDNLLHFLAQYYFSENATKEAVGLVSKITVTGITFVRTFFQVHGTVVEVLRMFKISYLVIPIVMIFFGMAFYRIVKSFKFLKSDFNHQFELTHFFIFVFQLGFALFSYGNSEFMVMFPFLIAIFIPAYVAVDTLAVKLLAVAMLIWNMTFAILPNYYIDFQNNATLIKLIKSDSDKVFIMKESYLIVNQYYYEYGEYNCSRILDNEDKVAIERFKRKNAVFYTDVLSKKVAYSRVDFTTNHKYDNLQFLRHVYKINTTMGGFYLDEVIAK